AAAGTGAGAGLSRRSAVHRRAAAPGRAGDGRRHVVGPDVQRPDCLHGHPVRAGRRRRHPGARSARPVWRGAGGRDPGVACAHARGHGVGVRRRVAAGRAPALAMHAEHFSLWVYLAASPLLWLTITVTVYVAADWMAERSGRHPVVNPVMMAIVAIAALLL